MEKCMHCESTDTKRFVVTVGGEPLRRQPRLCPEHGASFVLRMGMVLASLHHSIDEVFREAPSEHSQDECRRCGFVECACIGGVKS